MDEGQNETKRAPRGHKTSSSLEDELLPERQKLAVSTRLLSPTPCVPVETSSQHSFKQRWC